MENGEKKKERKGLSLRTTSTLLMIVSLLITIGLIVTGIRTFNSFRDMKKATEDHIELTDAAEELMDASDYLTDEVQLYTVMGDRRHMDNYFTEAKVNLRREHALSTMKARIPDSEALQDLMEGMRESVALMERECYAMRLMADAEGEKDLPDDVENVKINAANRAPTKEEKIDLARNMVHDDEYYTQKNKIRTNMAECVNEIKESTLAIQMEMENRTNRNMIWMSILIALQMVAFLLMLWVTTQLGINPVLRAVEHIRKGQKLPILGASEYRYLAGTYNVMYNAYKKSLEQMNFQASHDELTGVYNRAGYEVILSGLELETTAMLLFDADVFKSINDQFGHETGDKILKKISEALVKCFRSDDYVCRVGGDEFVVFMVHINKNPERLIEEKVIQVNRTLWDDSDGLPRVTLSAGVSYGTTKDAKEMFSQADTALYYVKDHGRNGCCFYTEDLGKGKDV